MTLLLSSSVFAQQVTLGNAIQIAQENSLDAKSAHFSFLASYWTYRSFKAELLPSVNFSGGLMNYNRSLVEARNYDDGRLSYVSNNTLSNSLTLSVDQQIAATGGTVSLMSYLHRLDQFTYKETTYNSQPLRISYTQTRCCSKLRNAEYSAFTFHWNEFFRPTQGNPPRYLGYVPLTGASVWRRVLLHGPSHR